jgi:hypothetical protein
MSNQQGYDEALKAVHDAEKEVYEAQSNAAIGDRQGAIMQVKIARDKVSEAQKQLDSSDKEGHHRLKLAMEQVGNLEEYEQAIED